MLCKRPVSMKVKLFFCKDCVLFFSPDNVIGLREVGGRKDRKVFEYNGTKF